MMRAKTGFTVNAIFVTHWHADHYLGIFGLVETMAFNGRTEPLTIYGPAGVEGFVEIIHRLTPKIPFVLSAVEVADGDVTLFDGYSVMAFKTYHGMGVLGMCWRRICVQDGLTAKEQSLSEFLPARCLENCSAGRVYESSVTERRSQSLRNR